MEFKQPNQVLLGCFGVLASNGYHVEATQMAEHVKRGAPGRDDAQANTILAGFAKAMIDGSTKDLPDPHNQLQAGTISVAPKTEQGAQGQSGEGQSGAQ